MSLSFIADINISPLTVSALTSAGYTTNRISEFLPASASDIQIVEFAIENDAVIITHDLDFTAIVAQKGLSKPSLISLRLGNVKPSVVDKVLLYLIPKVKSELLAGAIISVEEDNYRIRSLPVK